MLIPEQPVQVQNEGMISQIPVCCKTTVSSRPKQLCSALIRLLDRCDCSTISSIWKEARTVHVLYSTSTKDRNCLRQSIMMITGDHR